jgi:hypothetical protein
MIAFPGAAVRGIIGVAVGREERMTILLIIIAVIAAVYIYAAVANYYGFKNWNPLCGCKGASCAPKKTEEGGHPENHRRPVG